MNMTFKNIVFTLLTLFAAAACNDFENTFSESADERVKRAMEEYRNALLDAPNGWKAMILPGAGGGYLYYFKFFADGTVTMISDFNDSTAGEAAIGTYVMKGLQRPTLSFDTYSYIHLLADPTGSVNGGSNGEGLYSDFEFALEVVHGDTMEVVGIQRDTEMILVQATSQEQSEFLAGLIEQSRVRAATYLENNNYSFFDLGGGELLSVGFSLQTKVFNVFYIDNSSTIRQVSIPFIFSANGILLKEPFSYSGLSFRELLWDNAAQAFYILNGSTKVFIQGSPDPIIFTNASPTLVNALGFQYTTIDIYSPEVINGMSPEFTDLFNNASSQLEADWNVVLDHVSISFDASGGAVISYMLSDGVSLYDGNFSYNLTYGAGGTISFGAYTSFNGVGEAIEDSIIPLMDYFETYTFTWAYVPEANIGSLMARGYPQENGYFFYGILE